MARIIAIVNQKGGVGKTTTTVNITASLKALGKRVLLCDFDPQANATSGMGVDKNTASPNVYDVLINGADPKKSVVSTKYGDVIPSNKALAGAGIEMIAIPDREHLLKKALDSLAENYDYIFIDCPPSLELLTVNALCAAHSLIVPVQCEYYALEGLSDLLSTVRLVKRGLNPKLALEGVLLTMFDSRTNLSLQVAEEVKRHFPGQVYATVIPRNVRLSEAPSHGMPVTDYDPYSRGAEAYRSLAEEMASAEQLKRITLLFLGLGAILSQRRCHCNSWFLVLAQTFRSGTPLGKSFPPSGIWIPYLQSVSEELLVRLSGIGHLRPTQNKNLGKQQMTCLYFVLRSLGSH